MNGSFPAKFFVIGPKCTPGSVRKRFNRPSKPEGLKKYKFVKNEI